MCLARVGVLIVVVVAVIGSPSGTFGRYCDLSIPVSEKVAARARRVELSTVVQAHSVYVARRINYM